MSVDAMLNFPEELRKINQWCIAGPNKEPQVPMGNMLTNVSNKELGSLLSFDTACMFARMHNRAIGYVISANDEYTCIDLDVKDSLSLDRFKQPLHQDAWSKTTDIERICSIIETFDSYTELSNSGKGFHIWVKGDIGKGRRRGGIEVYSQERFIICTGNTLNNPKYEFTNNEWMVMDGDFTPKPIVNRQVLLNNMVQSLNEIRAEITLEEVEPTHSDQDILNMAARAVNNEKFVPLWEGRWPQLGYPSQSEADFSLMSMFTFYSKSNAQCRRLFRLSALGHRDKAIKNDYYLNKALQSIRARQRDEQAQVDRMTELAKGLRFNPEELPEKTVEPVITAPVAKPNGFQINSTLLQAAMDKHAPAPVQATPIVDTTPVNVVIDEPVEDDTPQNGGFQIDTKRLATMMAIPDPTRVYEEPKEPVAWGADPSVNSEVLAPSPVSHVPKTRPLDPDWFTEHPINTDSDLTWPPGIVGQIASFIYHSSHLPVHEVSLVGALGFIAGICGKAWNVPGSGLNVYMILVAASGQGKEGMHKGTDYLCAALASDDPNHHINKMVDSSNLISGPALHKHCLSNPSTCNFNSEFGKRIEGMAHARSGDANDTFRTMVTTLYNKSGANTKLGGNKSSNKENSVDGQNGVAFSIVGETTPGTFYNCLNDEMMSDGFLSRFDVVEYTGKMKEKNDRLQQTPDTSLLRVIENIVVDAVSINSANDVVTLGMHPEAKVIADEYDSFCRNKLNNCDGKGNSETNESIRQAYLRCYQKTIRYAGLLAVCEHYQNGHSNMGVAGKPPMITVEHFTWAKTFVERTRIMMLNKLGTGEIGISEAAQCGIMKSFIRAVVLGEYKPKNMRDKKMLKDMVISHALVNTMCKGKAAFVKAQGGVKNAIKHTINDLMQEGILDELSKQEIAESYQAGGRAFRIIGNP